MSAGGINDVHPSYAHMRPLWDQMADTYAGEQAVKQRRGRYLPPTAGMTADGAGDETPVIVQATNMPSGVGSVNARNKTDGGKRYDAYLERAVFHDIVSEAVKAMVGIMHDKPPTISVPKKMEEMLGSVSVQGEDAECLLRRINEAQLVKGRLGLLLDAPSGAPAGEAFPYIAVYDAESITNWDQGVNDEGKQDLEFVVLDESGLVREGFAWVQRQKKRLLVRGANALTGGEDRPQTGDPFRVAVYENLNVTAPDESDFTAPSIAGATLDYIPFTFVNSNDLVPNPDLPPLMGLSNLSLTIYRGEADYRQVLHEQAEETLVIIGDEDDEVAEAGNQQRTGAGAIIDLPKGGDAKYIGVSADGLGAMKEALENDKRRAGEKGAKFLDAGDHSDRASGEALRIRVSAKTTTLTSIAKTSAAALEQQLRWAAEWMGLDPEEVSVEANTDFADHSLQAQELVFFANAKAMGAPISWRSIHRVMRQNDLTDMTFEEEQAEIETEDPVVAGLGSPGGTPGGGGPTGPGQQQMMRQPNDNMPTK